MSQTLAATRITDREYAVEVDTALAAFWDVESDLNQPLVWAINALYRCADVDEVGKKYRYYDKPKPQATFKQVIQVVHALAVEGLKPWHQMDAAKALGDYTIARAKMDEVLEAQEDFNNEYADCGWTRAFLVLNTGGHVHKDRNCSTCYPTTSYGWLPTLSGSSEEEIVTASGADACTVCYPSAPVESLSRPRSVFHRTEQEAQQAREERAAAKADREAKKAAKALYIDLKPFGLTGYSAKIETITAARGWLTDCQQWNGWLAHEGRRHPSYPADAEQAVAEALAEKFGTTPQDEIDAAIKRAAKRK